MTREPRVRNAAIIADRWGMDIVAVLGETDDLAYCLRIAGHNVLGRLEEKARAK